MCWAAQSAGYQQNVEQYTDQELYNRLVTFERCARCRGCILTSKHTGPVRPTSAGCGAQPLPAPRLDDVVARAASSCRCFMFRAWRRAALTRRLARRRVDTDTAVGDSSTESSLCSIVSQLDDSHLEMLVEAVESGCYDGHATECIMVDVGAMVTSPHVVCCRMWRWPSLNTGDEIKRMPWCQQHISGADCMLEKEHQVCCHPYHWSHLLLPESPPPPYQAALPVDQRLSICREGVMHITKKSSPPSVLTSENTDTKVVDDDACTTISDEDDYRDDNWHSAWCRVTYWELRSRVGRQFSITDDWTNIFQDLPHGDGISLAALQQQLSVEKRTCLSSTFANGSDPSVLRTRAKIGRGLVLSRESDAVWLYNCSKHPVFVNSPLFNCTSRPSLSNTFVIKRVPPGHSLVIFDPFLMEKFSLSTDDRDSCGRYTVQVSFAKGWGAHYSRQFISACPCWIEVHVTHRHHHPVT